MPRGLFKNVLKIRHQCQIGAITHFYFNNKVRHYKPVTYTTKTQPTNKKKQVAEGQKSGNRLLALARGCSLVDGAGRP